MSCIGSIMENSKIIIKRENCKTLLNEIRNHNMKWNIKSFNEVISLETVFEYFGLRIIYNDYLDLIELDCSKGCFCEEDYSDEILSVIAKYVENGSILELDFTEYNEREKYVFEDKKVKKLQRVYSWKEV